MVDGLLTAVAFAVICVSFAMLALMQEEHWSAVAGKDSAPPPGRRWRWCAWMGLVLGCALCLAGNGTGFGILLMVLLLGAGAMTVAFTLAWKPHWLRPPSFPRQGGTRREPQFDKQRRRESKFDSAAKAPD